VDDTDDKVSSSAATAPSKFSPRRGRAYVVVLVNHFKSKGYGSKVTADAKRLRQARRVREIYEARLTQGSTSSRSSAT
jgi:predicted extracellular nuclease